MHVEMLARRCHANSANWFPTNHKTQRAAVTHCTLGLAGEAGETANKVKKLYGYMDQRNAVPEGATEAIIEELIDTLIYDLVLLDILGADIPAEVEKVVAKCVARWGAEAERDQADDEEAQRERYANESHRAHEIAAGRFPPHNPDYPDVNPATGDERETT